ncbi:hypothetical protein ACOMHN_059351 [Nucella lapillus]
MESGSESYQQVLYQHSRNAVAAVIHPDPVVSADSMTPQHPLFLNQTPTTTMLQHAGSSESPNITYYPLVKQPAYMIAILSVAYGLVLILALLGNTCVLAIVVKDKRFHSATFVFIANLAVADLLVALFCNPITLMSNIFNGE